MSEIPNDHIQDNPKTLDKINNSSESFTDSLENIEDKLNIDKDDLKVSDDVRAAYLKINSLSRAWPDNSKLEWDYSKIMDKYSELSSRSYESQQEYLEATKQLLLDLSTLELSSWEKLSDKSIDWWLFEAAIALKEGIIKAGETIYEELKWYFEMIWMVWDLPEIIEKIVGSLSFDTLTDIYKALVDMWWDTIRDFSLILKNSTGMWKAVELSHFVPSVGIPLLFDSVWPGKFFKILKIDKFIPEKALKAMWDIKEKWADALWKTFHKAEKIDLNPAEKIWDKVDAETIRNNFAIKDNETRKIAAVDTLTQKYGEQFKWFTREQLDWIIEAHEIWKELFTDYLQKHWLESVDQLSDTQLKEIFNSKEWRIALRQKMKKLKEAWVDMKYSDDLIRAGVTGGIEENLFESLLNKDFKSQWSSKIKIDNWLEVFWEAISMSDKMVARLWELKHIRETFRKELEDLYKWVNDISDRIDSMWSVYWQSNINSLNNQLNQQFLILKTRYNDLWDMWKEVKEIWSKLKAYERVTSTDDIVNNMLKMLDTDKWNFNSYENRYNQISNRLQKMSDNFNTKVWRPKVELPKLNENSNIFDTLMKAA